MDIMGFNLLSWDNRILTPKGAKKYFNAVRERLQFGICTPDAWSLRDYLGQIMIIGLSVYATNLHSLPPQWIGKEEEYKKYLLDTADMIRFALDEHPCPFEMGTPEYKEAMTKTVAQQQDCISQAFERMAEIFMDMWD